MTPTHPRWCFDTPPLQKSGATENINDRGAQRTFGAENIDHGSRRSPRGDRKLCDFVLFHLLFNGKTWNKKKLKSLITVGPTPQPPLKSLRHHPPTRKILSPSPFHPHPALDSLEQNFVPGTNLGTRFLCQGSDPGATVCSKICTFVK